MCTIQVQEKRRDMSVKIALAGNPNCGKTTLFNALTGSNPVSYTHLDVYKRQEPESFKQDQRIIWVKRGGYEGIFTSYACLYRRCCL